MKFRFWVQQILAASFVLTMLVACGGAANSTATNDEIAPAGTVTPAAPEATATPQPTLEPTVVPTPNRACKAHPSGKSRWYVAK